MTGDDYYDPHDILCGEQRVKVRFNQTVPWSPLLYCEEPSNSLIEKGSILEIPLWLAESLHESQLVNLLPPRAFSNRTLCDLEAGPESLAVRELSPYFYRFGEKCSRLLPSERCCQLMRKTLLARLEFLARPITMPSESKYVGSLSTTADPHRAIFHTSGHSFVGRLDHDEEQLYRAALDSRKRTDRWAERQSHRLSKLEIYAERRLGHGLS